MPTPPVKTEPKVSNEVKAEKPVEKFTEATISVLIPFKLNQLKLETATKAQIERTDMAIDFYQGIKMGIDSAASFGLNFKLNVIDSRDDNAYLSTLIRNETLKKSNLIIGPVFPDGIKYLSSFSISNDLPIVSPLAASKPSDFDNPKLISIVNNITQHGQRIAGYIGSKFQPGNGIVVLINTKKAEDEEFASPIKEFFKVKHPNLLVQEFSSMNVFETKMVKGKRYAVVFCSSDMAFVTPNLDKLSRIAKLRSSEYDFSLFGHPNWAKQNYKIEQLQSLKTIISSSYSINYKDSDVIAFVRKYRDNFNFEPSEFSFKGFDIGFYFGKLIAKHGKNYLDFLTKDKYRGLHNSFSFIYDPLYGYYNKDLMLFQYKNLSLSQIN